MAKHKALLSAISLPPHSKDQEHYFFVCEWGGLLGLLDEVTERIDTGVAYGDEAATKEAKEIAESKILDLGWQVTGEWVLEGDTWFADVN